MRALCFTLLLAAALTQAAEVKQGIPAKNIQTVTFQSASLGEDRHFNILLPPEYDTSTNRYPVLYLLHGSGDDHTAWSFMSNVSGYAAHHNILIVMPDASRSWYINSVSTPKDKFEDFISKDLVAYVDSHFRSIPQRRARAIAGLSMGGYGAAFIGLKHFNQFGAIGIFSGGFSIVHSTPQPAASPEAQRHSDELQAMFGAPGSPERTDRDPFTLIDKVPAAEMPFIYISCGAADSFVVGTREFVQLLSSKKIPYEYRESFPKGHSWDFWDDQSRIFLDLLEHRDGFHQN